MTLAVFEDSGWYRVNYAHADSFFWGRGTRANTLKLSPLAIWDSRNLSFRRFIIRAKSANDTLLTVINGSENAFDFNCGISGRVFLTFFLAHNSKGFGKWHACIPLCVWGWGCWYPSY